MPNILICIDTKLYFQKESIMLSMPYVFIKPEIHTPTSICM